MTPPNRATLWARTVVEEFAAAGVSGVCIAPGSRSTPLTVAFDAHPDIRVFSHLDERSAAFFALGRGKRTGEPTPVVCTSGTAAANLHPAVIEADQSRVPLVVLTADRPPELGDSGANQTIDQERLYGAATRWYRDLGVPEPNPRSVRSFRTTAARALAAATGTPPGPVHLNCRFRKPLEPTERPSDADEGVPERWNVNAPLAAEGRDGPFVRVQRGRPALDERVVETIADALDTERGLLVAGPASSAREGTSRDGHDSSVAIEADGERAGALAALAATTGFPLLADPLSGTRFGAHVGRPGDDADGSATTTHDADQQPLVSGGYDTYLDGASDWPDPDIVLRVGASPTSKVLRNYLEGVDAREVLVDSAGGWREATFTATDLVVAEPTRLARRLAERLDASEPPANAGWRERFAAAERAHWSRLDAAHDEQFFEGTVLADAAALAPAESTLFVSNSMPVRDLDRFGRPRSDALTVLGNRGASGIDGVVSSALGAGSTLSVGSALDSTANSERDADTHESLVLVIGDIAYYHDMNGLLAVGRCGVDATIVLVQNDGGGIFEMLPIADFDPPFTGQFKTPHGLNFAPTGDLYGLEFVHAETRAAFRDAYRASLDASGTQVIEVAFDSAASHRFRESLHERVVAAVRE